MTQANNAPPDTLATVLAPIRDAVSRLDIPAPYLYRQVFLAEQKQLTKEHAQLLREQARMKDQAYAAAMQVLRHGCQASPAATAKPRMSYLQHLRGGE
ncbi:hypothetical protein AB835_01590 [Candidatus Endobugula sertula]|uniref:Uncharacterized protein n=1 Tax=Candidatus Endobugula sertula TaxID=62101 RepID=A0A1D2QT66_9GAMM|nr:hypothetical protein AB835_01590 [Candidatus Endobugula sertula]